MIEREFMKADLEKALDQKIDYEGLLRILARRKTRDVVVDLLEGIDIPLGAAAIGIIHDVMFRDVDGLISSLRRYTQRKDDAYPFQKVDPHNSGIPSLIELARANLAPEFYELVAVSNLDGFALNVTSALAQNPVQMAPEKLDLPSLEAAADLETWVDPWRIGTVIAWMRGFSPTGYRREYEERLPIAEVTASRELVFTIKPSGMQEAEASFEIKAAGFALGYGSKAVVTYSGEEVQVPGSFQLQTTAFFEGREYENGAGERLDILNLKGIAPGASVISPPSSVLINLNYEGSFERIDAFESQNDSDSRSRTCSIARQHSATFSIAGEHKEPSERSARLALSSKAVRELSVTISYPARKRYIVRGLNGKSVVRRFEQVTRG